MIANCIVNKNIILEAILSNKTALYKFIASVIQPPTANDERNTTHFTSRLYKDKHTAKKSRAANKKRHKNKEYIKKQSFYNNNSIII